jgi:putative hemin transport protein
MMADRPALTPDQIRALRAENPNARARDFANMQGITEADLVAAHVGHWATAIDAIPDRLMPQVQMLGDVMALTRNESCVHERVGTYEDYHAGSHAQMVLGSEIDLRIFPSHWVHAFAVQEQGEDGVKRSLQVFDAAGDAVHKVHLKPASDIAAFDRLVEALRLPVESDRLELGARAAPEAVRSDSSRTGVLRAEWDKMTDTHQFLKLVRKLKMNRLGAYRVAGEPYVRALAPEAVTLALRGAAEQAVPVMIFVGNAGCIQIHGGTIEKIVPMGPWINVMDPRFNLHLRADHIAEVWCVTKPTQRGPAISVEAFDASGGLILQIFGYRKDVDPAAWEALCASLPTREEVTA